MCAYLDFTVNEDQNRLMRWSRRAMDAMQGFYRRTLNWSLDNPKTIMATLLVAVVLNVYLISIVPKGFFPDTDNGMIQGGIRAGGRQGNGDYQYTIQADTLEELNAWVPKITAALQEVPELLDVNSDQQDKGLQVDLKVDRATAARLGLNSAQVDNTLYDAF